ncbi:hypothetical protein CXF37_03350 [Corynebacterium bovis]|nr:hypothetical protein CXF36_03205 [Corynebacterium bovis]RRO84445.1 hypothetical protein CXF37_03350 [Corynebacterium bovis]
MLGDIVNACPPAAAPVTPADLTGCRHRAVLRRAAEAGVVPPETSPADLAEVLTHRYRAHLRRSAVRDRLPTAPRIGDRLIPTRWDITPGPTAEEETLEALAAGTRLIVGAHLADGPLATRVDLLVRADHGTGASPGLAYTPVRVSAHSVIRDGRSRRGSRGARCRVVDVAALGLSDPVDAPLRYRAAAEDSQVLAVAWVLLAGMGVASGDAGLIGAGSSRCAVFPAGRLAEGLLKAVSVPVPRRPLRVRECATCEFHNHCRAQLTATADVSLMLPGDRSAALREDGLTTVPALARADRGEVSALAAAWLRGERFLRRPTAGWIDDPRLWAGGTGPGDLDGCVEVDVDMEAHPGRGTFLWGTWDGVPYRAFADFGVEPDEGAHVARFWSWLTGRRDDAVLRGRRFRAYCYSAQGENHWLREYATAYGGRRYPAGDGGDGGDCGDGSAAGDGTVVMPTRAEVDAFLTSEHWVDVFAVVRRAVAANDSLGLKNTGVLAGYAFSQGDMDGREAVDRFEAAVAAAADGRGDEARDLRRILERYNADDCMATAAVRRWLRRGAPGIPGVEDVAVPERSDG